MNAFSTFSLFVVRLGVSIPTGSDVSLVLASENTPGDRNFAPNTTRLEIRNDAVHLMPFLGVYRTHGDRWWLQAFTQIDTPTSGNDVRRDGVFRGSIREQTLLYADASLGKWWYRNRCNVCCRGCGRRRRGVTGIASVLELHYTTTLNDANQLFPLPTSTDDLLPFLASFDPAPVHLTGVSENRFDVLNLTLGLQFEFNEQVRINVAGVLPLRERSFDDLGERREDRFFDSEFSLQINSFF